MSTDVTTCGFMNIRRIARLVGQFYDQRLAVSGHTTSQFILLAALEKMGPTALTPLADFLEMDRTTLTRNLKILQTQGLVATSKGDDARVRLISLTADGENILELTYPAWEAAHAAFLERLGPGVWPHLLDQLNTLADRIRP
ncbi:MarR family winged helix-turn-helix transcriptional regulator [Labrenzia sp. PHM005]|uniref:MarR family winged helix-turn-helix transcriptional regulator n=1 Tax=Labrenzia sp. PHM005 TaxID=2590016 RepID=UPI00113FC88F|nr:MarR family winged helix-turn-helix transcriptional regulator [Labrenzia sp. PHM005]QDG76652.1 winged helix-turn-helix transcriptional regulator [Labrenzia sp. PHM005]